MTKHGPAIKNLSGSRKGALWHKPKKLSFFYFLLLVSYNSPPLGAKILEGKTFHAQRNWQLNKAVFSKAIEPEIEKT